MPRLTCVVEGRGELSAVPNLCARILRELGRWDWFVDQEPIRHPRSRLVDESVASPARPANARGIERVCRLAVARGASAVLVLTDSDDDCPAVWGPAATTAATCHLKAAAVMAVREYEAWILHGFSPEERALAGIVRHPDKIRNCKGALRKLMPGYQPTIHQLEGTRRMVPSVIRTRSRSFDKFYRAVEGLTA